jgi:hypothetical protein
VSPRSRAIVGVEVKCSLCVQLSALFTRRDPASTKGTIPPFAPRIWLNTALYLHICPTTNATPAPQQHSRTNRTPHPSASVVPLPSSRTIQIQHTRQQCTDGACIGWGTWSGARLRLVRHPPPSRSHPLPQHPFRVDRGDGLLGAPLRRWFTRCAVGEEWDTKDNLYGHPELF